MKRFNIHVSFFIALRLNLSLILSRKKEFFTSFFPVNTNGGEIDICLHACLPACDRAGLFEKTVCERNMRGVIQYNENTKHINNKTYIVLSHIG